MGTPYILFFLCTSTFSFPLYPFPIPSFLPPIPASFDAPAAEFVQLLGSLSRRLKAFSNGTNPTNGGTSSHGGGSLRGSINAGGMSPRPIGVSLIGSANTPAKPTSFSGGGAGGSFPIPMDGFPSTIVVPSASTSSTAGGNVTKLTEMSNTHHDGCVVLEDEDDGTGNDGHAQTPNPRRNLSLEINTATTTSLHPLPTAANDDKDNTLLSWSALAAEAEVILQGNLRITSLLYYLLPPTLPIFFRN